MQRKAHSALQLYLAMFQTFVDRAQFEDKKALENAFQSIKMEARSLMCFVESVINGTHLQSGQGPPGPVYKYYTAQVMERKLKALKEVLKEEQNALPKVSKVVFLKYKDFIGTLMEKAHNRMKKVNEVEPTTKQHKRKHNKNRNKNGNNNNKNNKKNPNKNNNKNPNKRTRNPNRNRINGGRGQGRGKAPNKKMNLN